MRCNETVDMIDAHIAIASKQIEVLKESRAHHVDARQSEVVPDGSGRVLSVRRRLE